MKSLRVFKPNLYLPEWAGDSMALALIFTWLLSYPMYGPFLQAVFGTRAYVLGHIFTASHGLGLIIFAFLSPSAAREKRTLKISGIAIFALTGLWTFVPLSNYLPYYASSLLGFASAYLVLAWIPHFINKKNPALTVGFAMAITNILLGLAGFAHHFSDIFLRIAASSIGLAPLLSAFYMSKKHLDVESTPHEAGTGNQKIGTGPVIIIFAFAAAAYFSGGLWYRVVLPLFYSRWPELMGVDSFIYAIAVLGLALYAEKHSFKWLGTISLSLLGIGLTISITGLEQAGVVIATLLFLVTGLGATDLFYWLTLRKLGLFLGYQKTFGLGLGMSLFFITAPGIALDTQILTDPLSSPIAAVSGACLLFTINPLLVWFLLPLSFPEKDENSGVKTLDHITSNNTVIESNAVETSCQQFPAFWFNLTNSEKKVYELICKGHTDMEIAEILFISRHTVKFHARNILRKSGVSNRKELLAFISNNR